MLMRRRPMARMATTAVVAGTAAHMGAKSAQRSAAAAEPQYAPAPPPEQAPPPPAAAPAPAGGLDDGEIEELKQFAELNKQGILTDEEFAAKKAQILGL